MVDDPVVEESTYHEEIGLRGFDFNYFGGDEEGVVREGSSEFPYLLMLIKLLPVNCKTNLRRIIQKVDEEMGKH